MKKEKKFSLLIGILLAVSFLFLLQPNFLINKEEVQYLVKPEAGEKKEKTKISVQTEEENNEQINLVLEVPAKQYTKEELKQCFLSAKKYCEENIFPEGESADASYGNFHLITKAPGGVSISWKKEDIEDNMILLTAILTCQEETQYFEIPVHLVEKSQTLEEKITGQLQDFIKMEAENKPEASKILLPKELEGQKLFYYRDTKSKLPSLILLVGISLGALWFRGEEQKRQRVKKRKKELQRIYPEVVNQFAILLSAGFTISGAWNKIAEQSTKRSTALEEEMKRTANEIKNGETERKAYENFGNRMIGTSYRKLISILTQNLRLGNRQIITLLLNEAQEALEEQRVAVKKLGEEASTKMMLPMFLQLIVVMTLVLAPVFMTL